jgi:NADPH-dependent 2,4-dienoyl-CoA reductase/sulfur reductase-like enzyme
MTTGRSDDTTNVVGALGASIGPAPDNWDLVADVVVIGAGATGLPAAIAARVRGHRLL